MGTVTAIKGQTINVNLLDDSRDNGWVISNGVAIHNGCNQGYIELINSNYTVGVPNTFTFVVSGYSSGNVNIQVGAINGITRTANGAYSQVFTPVLNDKVRFFSDGNLGVQVLSISPVQEDVSNGVTIGFDEKFNKWVSYYSYEPEMMINGLNSFFSNKNGGMWRHGVNVVRNNFYGEQFTSRVTFFVNLNPTQVKNFFSMRQKSNKAWAMIDGSILPSEGKELGQRTRLKKNNLKKLNNGDWFSKILRNIDDPRYGTELDALMKGSQMQGGVLSVTLENDDIVEVRMLSVDVEVSPQNFTY